jgi:hypothetical protein
MPRCKQLGTFGALRLYRIAQCAWLGVCAVAPKRRTPRKQKRVSDRTTGEARKAGGLGECSGKRGAVLLRKGVVWCHCPEFVTGVCGVTALAADVCVPSTCAVG